MGGAIGAVEWSGDRTFRFGCAIGMASAVGGCHTVFSAGPCNSGGMEETSGDTVGGTLGSARSCWGEEGCTTICSFSGEYWEYIVASSINAGASDGGGAMVGVVEFLERCSAMVKSDIAARSMSLGAVTGITTASGNQAIVSEMR